VLLLLLLLMAAAAAGDTVPRAYDEYDVSDRLKESGWVLPAYTMAPNAGHIVLLRAVIRSGSALCLCGLCGGAEFATI
jgi:hypothetical protein